MFFTVICSHRDGSLEDQVIGDMHMIIVRQELGFETLQVSKAKTEVSQFLLKAPQLYTIFCFTFTHYGWI